MHKKIKVILAFVLSFTMIFTLNISAFAETIEEITIVPDQVDEPVIEPIVEQTEEPTEELEPPATDDIGVEKDTDHIEEDIEQEEPPSSELEVIPKEEETDPISEETDKEEDKEVEETEEDEEAREVDDEEELATEDESKKEEVVEELESLMISLSSQVELYNESYTNGDILDYEIIIRNDGNVEVYNLFISDDLGLNQSIDILYPGDSETIYGEYSIPLYNESEQLENNISIYTNYDDEHLTMDLNFRTDIYIPKGSITISNDVDYVEDENQEFHIFVKGPNNTEYTVSLKNRESATIDNLFIGEYTIIPVVPMNYSSSRDHINLSILPDSLNHHRWISYYQNNTKGFNNRSDKQIQGYEVSSRDVTHRVSRYEDFIEEKREAYVFLDLGIPEIEVKKEPVVITPEINKEKKKQEEVLPDKEDGNKDKDEEQKKDEDEKIADETIKDVPITEPVIPTEEAKVDEVKRTVQKEIDDEIKLPDEIPILKDQEELTKDE